MITTGHSNAQGARRSGILRNAAGLLLLLLTGCATISPGPKATGVHAKPQAERIFQESLQLDQLETVDMTMSFDNAILAPHLQDLLTAGFARIPAWSADTVKVRFLAGYVAVDVQGSYAPTPDNPLPVSLSGELVPYFQPGALSWQLSLHDLQAPGLESATGVDSEGAPSDAPPVDSLTALKRLQRELREVMTEEAERSFAMDPMPLGILETGIRLRAPFELTQSESSTLAGVLTIAGSATLIQADETRLALDLGFTPTPPDCAGSVQIGRATFAQDVQNREPVSAAVGRAPQEQAQYFFTDVLDARNQTTVIHYWFADGQPASISELNVDPSARWRTWSAAPEEATSTSNWQVLVVEKRSGCVLAHRSLQVEPAAAPGDIAWTSNEGFPALAAQFADRTAGHEGNLGDAESALISIDRRFFSSALSEAMYDLQLASTSQIDGGQPIRIDAQVGAVPAETLSCNRQSCDSERVCTLNFDKCPVQRDTRDCSSCLLRNPLNNRCIREAEDPICLAARDNENARLENNRQVCIVRETRLRDNCVLDREREMERCGDQVSREVSSCAAQLAEMKTRFESQGPIADLDGQATLSGSMMFEFSEFRLDEDLGRIRMILSLDADLVADTQINFEAAAGLNMLKRCLQATSDDYRAPLALPLWQGGLVAEVNMEGTSLLAEWSGLIQRLESDPAPVMQFFASNQDALTRCDIGLDAAQLLKTLSGRGTDLLLGNFDLDMQPEPTRITLLPAYLSINEDLWTGDASIGSQYVKYRLKAGNGIQ